MPSEINKCVNVSFLSNCYVSVHIIHTYTFAENQTRLKMPIDLLYLNSMFDMYIGDDKLIKCFMVILGKSKTYDNSGAQNKYLNLSITFRRFFPRSQSYFNPYDY